jgi:FKBP-type peptidyl-prolyl cis-trans isomerase 2
MIAARLGDTVHVKYRICLVTENGGEPPPVLEETVAFPLGTGGVLPGFERAVIGMSEGDLKTVTLHPEDAYGPYEPERVFSIDRGLLPAELEPLALGCILRMSRGDAPDIFVTVKDVTPSIVVLDANHPMAGQHVTFEIQVLRIESPHNGDLLEEENGRPQAGAA